MSTNGLYGFGGGAAYAQTDIPSLSGHHDLHAGDLAARHPDGLLAGTPHSYTITVARPCFSQGNFIGEVAVRREAYNFYFQDSLKVNSSPDGQLRSPL